MEAPPTYSAVESRAPAEPGELGIAERRSWSTPHLVAVGLACVVVGMIIGYSGKRPSAAKSTQATTGGLINLNGTSGSATASTPTTRAAITPGTVPPTPTSAVVTTLAPASATPAAASCNVPKGSVLPNTPGTGSSDLPAFNTTGTWCVGWVFDCSGAPGGSAAFAIVMLNAAGGQTNAVQQSGRKASGVTPEPTKGTQHLRVATDPGCRWAIKVSST